MMAVMLPVKPVWCEKILNRDKTLEIRKTRPKLETPFKVYIYCSSVKHLNLENYVSLHRKTAGSVDYWSEKVIAEFTCDWIKEIAPLNHAPDNVEEMACLTREQIVGYCKGHGCAWHISDLKVYDKPREITDFGWLGRKLTRAPQSWCYVEELENVG